MSLFIDYYEVLGVTLKSSNEEIDATYKKLIFESYSKNNNSDKILLLNKAYETLKDPILRNEYNCNYFKYYSNGTYSYPINTQSVKRRSKYNKPLIIFLTFLIIIGGIYYAYTYTQNKKISAQIALKERNEVINYYNEIRSEASALDLEIRELEQEIDLKKIAPSLDYTYDFSSKENELGEMYRRYVFLKDEIKSYKDIVKSYEE